MKLVKFYRFIKELKQGELARECGRSQPWLHMIESGGRVPDNIDLILLAKTMGIKSECLIGSEQEMHDLACEAAANWLKEAVKDF